MNAGIVGTPWSLSLWVTSTVSNLGTSAAVIENSIYGGSALRKTATSVTPRGDGLPRLQLPRPVSSSSSFSKGVASGLAVAVQNHPPSTVPKFHHRHGRSTNGDCVQALPNVSEALDRQVGIAERCGIIGAELSTAREN